MSLTQQQSSRRCRRAKFRLRGQRRALPGFPLARARHARTELLFIGVHVEREHEFVEHHLEYFRVVSTCSARFVRLVWFYSRRVRVSLQWRYLRAAGSKQIGGSFPSEMTAVVTSKIFQEGGFTFSNDAVVVTVVASLPDLEGTAQAGRSLLTLKGVSMALDEVFKGSSWRKYGRKPASRETKAGTVNKRTKTKETRDKHCYLYSYIVNIIAWA